jgi:autotransporter-associated beta strand protein
MKSPSPRRRRDRLCKSPRIQLLFLERFGGERLEERRVMDASAVPLWEQAPAATTQMLSLSSGVIATAAAQSDDFTYTISNGEVAISGYTGTGGDVAIPGLIDGLPVTAISDSAFKQKTSITRVFIPDGVKSIGRSAFFGCESLADVRLAGSVNSIESNAFRQCRSLTSVNIPSGVTTISEYAFYKCTNLSVIEMPSTVTGIDQYAFYDCNALASVVLSSDLNRLGDYAFAGCNTLSSVSIPASVTSIGSSTFLSCNNLRSIHVEAANPSYASIDGVLFNKTSTTLIRMPGGRSGAYAVPSGVTTVAARAFYGCARLTSVTIPTSVMRLEDLAFGGCNGLTSVNIPSSVTSVLGSTFRSCSSLVSIVVDSNNPSYTSVDGVLFNKSLTTLLRCPGGRSGKYTIPSGVTSVQAYAFYECFDLASVVVPSSVAAIGGYALSGCSSMTSIDVDAANGNYASNGGILYDKAVGLLIQCPGGFSGGVEMPGSVRGIGPAAFSGCNGVLRVSVPAGVTSVGSFAFNSCARLQALYFYGDRPTVSTDLFTESQVTVYRLSGATGWMSLLQDVPVKVFQVCDVPAGQTISSSVDVGVERFVKRGSGTAVLSVSSVHSSGTVIEEGEVVVRNRSAFGLGSLELLAGARVSMQMGSETVKVTALSLGTTSRVDVGTGRIRVAANGYTEADIRANLIAGRNRGSWNGANGIRSTVAGSDGSRAIGYRVTGGEMEVAFAAPGDSNLDGVVDILDLSEILGGGKFNTDTSANWEQGDTNYDGIFDILDISAIIGTGLFNQGTYLTQGSASSAAADTEAVATFDSALVFTALAAEPSTQTTTRRKSV